MSWVAGFGPVCVCGGKGLGIRSSGRLVDTHSTPLHSASSSAFLHSSHSPTAPEAAHVTHKDTDNFLVTVGMNLLNT
jgi:hypothetical protein